MNEINPTEVVVEEQEIHALAVASPLDLPTNVFREGLERRSENRGALMEWVRSAMVQGVDFGSIQTKRGPSKPSLWKPGAEKICGMLGLTVHFPNLSDYEQSALNGVELQNIIIRCDIVDGSGHVVGSGVGARSLKQDYGDINKALKMAEKSAHIDATLRMAGLSEVFTQDLEDMNISAMNIPHEATKITEEEALNMHAMLHENGIDNDKFMKWLKSSIGVESINEIRTDQLGRVEGMIKKSIEAKLKREEEANE